MLKTFHYCCFRISVLLLGSVLCITVAAIMTTAFTTNRLVRVSPVVSSWKQRRLETKDMILKMNSNLDYEGISSRNCQYHSSLKNNTITSVFDRNKQLLRQSTRLSLAPMMDYTTRHFRFLIRLLTRNTLLYTEMVAANALCQPPAASRHSTAIINNNFQEDWHIRRYLAQSSVSSEGPSVLQLGGSDPQQLFRASEIIALSNSDYSDYTAINLNCGCPSPKVATKGCFGAALMHQPTLVRDLCTAMYEGAQRTLPVTVKCRLGTDSEDFEDLYTNLYKFIDTVASNGIVTDFQIHARIAILNKKLSPSENRKIPKLQYDIVRKLVQDFPELTFSLNGGIESIFQAHEELEKCQNLAGIMVGRSMAAQPWHWAMADSMLYNDIDNDSMICNNRWEVLQKFGVHADKEEQMWGPKIRPFILKAIQGLFSGEPNAKHFRAALGNLPKTNECNLSELILLAATDCFSDEVLMRSKQESLEIARSDWILFKNGGITAGAQRSAAVQEWQHFRKEEEEKNMQEAARSFL